MKNTTLNELKMMCGSTRLNRIRYISYCGFLSALYFFVDWVFSKWGNGDVRLGAILFMGLVVCIFSIWWAARRLHDMNLSAKWLFLLLVFPVILGMQKSFSEMITLFFIGMVLHACITLFLMAVPGTREKNRFGEVPIKNTSINYVFFWLFFVLCIAIPVWKGMAIWKEIESDGNNFMQMNEKEKAPFHIRSN